MIDTSNKLYLQLKYGMVMVEEIFDKKDVWMIDIDHSIPDKFFTEYCYSRAHGSRHEFIRYSAGGCIDIDLFYANLLDYTINEMIASM